MSSADKFTASAFLALTCQKIKPPQRSSPRAAAIKAFVVEFKIMSLSELLLMLH
jgi:hypothetical protein